MKRRQPNTCIYCDYTEFYYNEVMEAAIEIMQQWNASHDEDEQSIDWRDFESEAIDIVAKYKDTDTQCDECYDGYDY
jgi:hypothetical protein